MAVIYKHFLCSRNIVKCYACIFWFDHHGTLCSGYWYHHHTYERTGVHRGEVTDQGQIRSEEGCDQSDSVQWLVSLAYFSEVCLSNFSTRSTLGAEETERTFIQATSIYWGATWCHNVGMQTTLGRKFKKPLTFWSWHSHGIKWDHVCCLA